MAKKRAFVRYSKQGKIVPGSLILTSGSFPSGPSTWSEVPADLCCNNGGGIFPPENSFLPWELVTGGVAGDGMVLIDDVGEECSEYTFVGPNDNDGTGWVYLKRRYSTTTCLEINYEWTSFDESGPNNPPSVDRPVYWMSSTEPTGIPGNLTSQVGGTPASGTWNITVPAGQWFGIGIYSSDSCCGRGFLQTEICEVPCPTTTTTTTAAPTTTTTTTAAPTTTTTTTEAPPLTLYEGTLTVGENVEDGNGFGYNPTWSYGSISPSLESLARFNWYFDNQDNRLEVNLDDFITYQHVDVYINSVLYTLPFFMSLPISFKIYSLILPSNPFPLVGQTCTIQIVAGPLAP